MKNKYLLLVALFILINPFSVEAYIGLCCGKCGGNMPMNTLGGGVPETKEFRLKVSPMFMKMDGLRNGTNAINNDSLLSGMSADYMAVPTSMEMKMTNLAVGYSFTDDFFGGIMVMWKKNEMDMKFGNMMKMATGKDEFIMESDGFADTMIMTKYRLYTDDPLIPLKQVSLFFGLSIPTGSINEKNSTHPLAQRAVEQLPYSMQLGSGTYDPTIGLLYQGSSSPWWWGANMVHTARLSDNDKGYRLGNEVRLDLYSMYQVRYDTVLQFQLNGQYQGKIKGEMDDVTNLSVGKSTIMMPTGSGYTTPLWDTANYGGKKLLLTGGVQWQPFPLHIIDLNIGIPIYQNLNGPQLEEDYRVMLTWYIEIPTSKSIRYTGGTKQEKSRLGF